jgi:hypothetical protein
LDSCFKANTYKRKKVVVVVLLTQGPIYPNLDNISGANRAMGSTVSFSLFVLFHPSGSGSGVWEVLII